MSMGGDVGETAAVVEFPLEGSGDWHGFGDAGGFDDDVFEFAAARELADVFNEVISQCAADAAVGHFDETILAALEICALLDEGGVDVDFREVVDDDRDFAPL